MRQGSSVEGQPTSTTARERRSRPTAVAVTDTLAVPADTASITTPLRDPGLSSRQLARFTAALREAAGHEVSLADLLDHPDIGRLVEYLATP